MIIGVLLGVVLTLVVYLLSKIRLPRRTGWRGLQWGSEGFVAGSPHVKSFDFVRKCPECYGKGWDADWGGPYICDFCGGTGRHPDSSPRKCKAKGHQLCALRYEHKLPYSFTASCPCGQRQEDFVGPEACREARKYGVWFGPRDLVEEAHS